jgi:hypothetical protein
MDITSSSSRTFMGMILDILPKGIDDVIETVENRGLIKMWDAFSPYYKAVRIFPESTRKSPSGSDVGAFSDRGPNDTNGFLACKMFLLADL